MSKPSEPIGLVAGDLDPIVRRLDVLIALMSRVQPTKERAKISDQIRLLGALGLDNPAIAGIVGRGTDFVGVVRKRGRTAKPRGGTKGAGKKARASRSASR